MFYADVLLLKPTLFNRLTGVPLDTFAAICEALSGIFPQADAGPNTAKKTGS